MIDLFNLREGLQSITVGVRSDPSSWAVFVVWLLAWIKRFGLSQLYFLSVILEQRDLFLHPSIFLKESLDIYLIHFGDI